MDPHGHSAAVKLHSGSLICEHNATWINILEAIHEGEECFFLLPLGTVVTGPEWCQYLGLSEQQQQQWQQLISVTESKGVIVQGMTISQVLGSNWQSQVDADIVPAAQANNIDSHHCKPIVTQQQQADGCGGMQLSTAAGNEYSIDYSVGGNSTKQQPAQCMAAKVSSDQQCHFQGDNSDGRLYPSSQDGDAPMFPQGNTHIWTAHVGCTIEDVPAERQQPSTTSVPRVTGLSNQLQEGYDVQMRRLAVRVTITNYKTRQTVYALWINADTVLQQLEGPSSVEALFLPCMDDNYQPASNATPVNAMGLARQAFMPMMGNIKLRIRLNQRFKTAKGYCFHPGMSVDQVLHVMTSDVGSSHMIFGQDWDETAAHPVVECNTKAQICVRVMAYYKRNGCAVYANAHLTMMSDRTANVMFTICDSYYNVKQPAQPMPTEVFCQQAGYAKKSSAMYYTFVFLTQSLQLPSGYMLPPGISLQQVIDELHTLRAHGGVAPGTPALTNTQLLNTHGDALDSMSDQIYEPAAEHQMLAPVQSLAGGDDLRRRRQAVRVTLTNYGTRQTVHALWPNADDVFGQTQAPYTPELWFMPCMDETYQLTVGTMPVTASGLARLASIPNMGVAKHRIRLNQRFRAATGHCFYPGMSLAQVMLALSSSRQNSNVMFGQDWDESATELVACCNTAGQACVRVMAFHTGTMRAVYATAHLTARFNRRDVLMFSVCDSNYNIQQPVRLVRTRTFLQQAGYAETSSAMYYTFVFLTQSLQLPSGYVLPPETSLHQVGQELDRLMGKDGCVTSDVSDDDDDEEEEEEEEEEDWIDTLSHDTIMEATSSVSDEQLSSPSDEEPTSEPCVSGPSQPMQKRDDAVVRRQDLSRAVCVTVTNCDTHQTVYALWTNVDDVIQQCQTSTAAEPLFLVCTDHTHQPAVSSTHVNAVGLVAKLTSIHDAASMKEQIRLSQQHRAATGHCFYRGMSLAQAITEVRKSNEQEVVAALAARARPAPSITNSAPSQQQTEVNMQYKPGSSTSSRDAGNKRPSSSLEQSEQPTCQTLDDNDSHNKQQNEPEPLIQQGEQHNEGNEKHLISQQRVKSRKRMEEVGEQHLVLPPLGDGTIGDGKSIAENDVPVWADCSTNVPTTPSRVQGGRVIQTLAQFYGGSDHIPIQPSGLPASLPSQADQQEGILISSAIEKARAALLQHIVSPSPLSQCAEAAANPSASPGALPVLPPTVQNLEVGTTEVLPGLCVQMAAILAGDHHSKQNVASLPLLKGGWLPFFNPLPGSFNMPTRAVHHAKAAGTAVPVAARTAVETAETLERLPKGSVTRAMFVLLLAAGPNGMYLDDLVEAMEAHGAASWREETHRASLISSWCALRPAMTRVAPYKFAVSSLLPSENRQPPSEHKNRSINDRQQPRGNRVLIPTEAARQAVHPSLADDDSHRVRMLTAHVQRMAAQQQTERVWAVAASHHFHSQSVTDPEAETTEDGTMLYECETDKEQENRDLMELQSDIGNDEDDVLAEDTSDILQQFPVWISTDDAGKRQYIISQAVRLTITYYGTHEAANALWSSTHGLLQQPHALLASDAVFLPSTDEAYQTAAGTSPTHAARLVVLASLVRMHVLRHQLKLRKHVEAIGQCSHPRVSPAQAVMEVGDIGKTKFVISRAVRVTLTNYDAHQTVYALWINADEVSQEQQAHAPAEPLFLRFLDEAYQHAVDIAPVNATDVARTVSMPETGNSKHRVRLNQRFRAVTGHCFYAGMSVMQALSVMSAGTDANHLMLGQDWDETAVDPIVTYNIAEQAHVRVMTINSGTMCAVYAQATLMSLPDGIGQVMLADKKEPVMHVMCDAQYNVMQPEQVMTTFKFLQQAGFSCKGGFHHYKSVFLTHSLQLPSGFVLPPGTSLKQVFEELNKLKSWTSAGGPEMIHTAVTRSMRAMPPGARHDVRKRRAVSSLEPSKDFKRHKAATDSYGNEQMCFQRQKHRGVQRCQGKQEVLVSQHVATKKMMARANKQPQLPPLGKQADIPAANKNVETGSPTSVASTAVMQPLSPVPRDILHRYGFGRRQQAVITAVRVTLTNYDTCQTVYALWTNADDAPQQRHGLSRSEPWFLPCIDDCYQPAVHARPVNATGLAEFVSMRETGSNMQRRVRLNQRFRAATGHCFYPGMSLAQVLKVIVSTRGSSQFKLGQDWDESATDLVACCNTAGQACVRVMAFYQKDVRAVYAEAHITAGGYDTMFTVCDSHYNVQRPVRSLGTPAFLQAAGYAKSSEAIYTTVVFLTQSLQLPSGHVLLPGTSLHQVIEELNRLYSRGFFDDSDEDVDHEDEGACITTSMQRLSSMSDDDQPSRPQPDEPQVPGIQADDNARSRQHVVNKAVGKKRPGSPLEQTTRPTRQILGATDSSGMEEAGHEIQEQQPCPENEERVLTQQIATKKKLARVDEQPLLPPLEKQADMSAADKNVETGTPTSVASTAVMQPLSPVPDDMQYRPTENTSPPQQVEGKKAPPPLPKLDINGKSIHPLSVIRAWSAICSLLRFLGCSNEAVKQMWLTKQQWEKEGEEKMHDFAASYAELADAVDYRDWEYVKQILQDNFQLPV